ncbi:MAG: leucyl/phenylalanyl-tRNA--protein transferase [Chitinophagales bacterium]|nr:leucyl/phenylalanyl-tRNA--protein transferase [Chitinophagales bacterium]
MSIYILDDEIFFPPLEHCNSDGILAIGGDLKTDRLHLAYRSGIFPWYNKDEPIIWHSPDPRFVLFPKNLKVSKSMRKILRDKKFRITYDQSFVQVIHRCSAIKRKDQYDTWITTEMIEAYKHLHEMGSAHSVEAWIGDELVGGLYGIIIGDMFFGESMFSDVSNASKTAFVSMVEATDFSLIDCQVYTDHLSSLGAELISRDSYIHLLKIGVEKPPIKLGGIL